MFLGTILQWGPAAFIAGLLMFLAPCTLPLIPGYIAFIGGAGIEGYTEGRVRRRIVLNALAFVIGFSIVFILFGIAAGSIGVLLGPWREVLSRLAGIMIIIFGLTMLSRYMPFLSQERHIPIPSFLTLGKWESSLLIGIFFALGWSPCIGPILGSILLFASISATMLQGAVLLGIFSLGFGIPFLIVALCIGSIDHILIRMGAFTHTLSILGGVLLVLLGSIMLCGESSSLVSWGFFLLQGIHYNHLLQYM